MIPESGIVPSHRLSDERLVQSESLDELWWPKLRILCTDMGSADVARASQNIYGDVFAQGNAAVHLGDIYQTNLVGRTDDARSQVRASLYHANRYDLDWWCFVGSVMIFDAVPIQKVLNSFRGAFYPTMTCLCADERDKFRS